MTLKEHLMNFKNTTIETIKALKEDNIDDMLSLIEKRENIINEIKKLNIDSFGEIGRELDLMTLERELNRLFLIKKNEIKEKLRESKKTNTASRTYNNNRNAMSGFLNLKI